MTRHEFLALIVVSPLAVLFGLHKQENTAPTVLRMNDLFNAMDDNQLPHYIICSKQTWNAYREVK